MTKQNRNINGNDPEGSREDNAHWDNKDELYIGLIKETVRKYMKEYEQLISFWGYCVEKISQINNLTHHNLF